MFKITIVSLFCDKDYHLVDFFLEKLKENIKVDYDVILIDNVSPEYQNKVTSLYEKYPFIYRHPENKNVYQYKARLFALDKIKTEYTWFIDIDDYPEPFEEKDLHDADITYYSYHLVDEDIVLPAQNNIKVPEVFTKQEFDSLSLWNKIFKTTILKEASKRIPKDLEIRTYEDTILLVAALKCCETYDIDNKIILFKTPGMVHSRDQIEETMIDYISYGVKNSSDVLKTLLTTEELKNFTASGDPFLGNCWTVVDKIMKGKLNKRASLFKKLADYYDKPIIVEAARQWMCSTLDDKYGDQLKANPLRIAMLNEFMNIVEGYLC